MTKNIGLPWNSLPVEKEDCCEAHLRPLLDRIDHLEGRLLVETERRENEYNELLKMFLTIKREQRKDTEAGHTAELSIRNRQNSKASRKITSPSPRMPVTKLPLNLNRKGKEEPKLKSILVN